jgi:hypothetical protein
MFVGCYRKAGQRAQVTDPYAPETITIRLTIPPTKQVVFAVGCLLAAADYALDPFEVSVKRCPSFAGG